MAAGKSSPISGRRELLEELLAERSKVVAGMPITDQDPPSSSVLWPLGALRVTGGRWLTQRGRRRAALDLGVLALAWLERIDSERAKAPAERQEE